jgi:hypothetical protein
MAPWRKKLSLHWVRNSTQSLDFVGSPELTAFWLGTRDQQSPLSLLLGLEDTVLAHVLSYTDSAIFMCDCCKDRPLVYCYKKQKRYIKDLAREPRHDASQGEVPEMLFCNDKVLLWAENVYGYEFNASSQARGSGANTWPFRDAWYMVCTETGFFSPMISFLWQDIIEFNMIYVNSERDGHSSDEICFEKTWYDGEPIDTKHTRIIGIRTKRASSFLKIIQSKVWLQKPFTHEKYIAALWNPPHPNSNAGVSRGGADLVRGRC